jgi:membrane protein YqaA with SNARE-associated domain
MTDLSTWTGLGSLALISAWCHGPASPFLPAAFEPVLMAYGRIYPPLVVALVGTAASIAVEAVNYLGYGWLLHARRLGRVREVSAGMTRIFGRHPFLACLLVASTPAPDWSARILGALARYPARRYLLAFAVGRLAKFWLLATVGQVLQLSRSAVLALVVGSVLVTYGGVAVRRWHGAGARAAP